MRRTPVSFHEYYAGNPPDARYAPVLTYPEWLRARRRRERLKTLAGYVAAIGLALLLAWVAVGVAVGP